MFLFQVHLLEHHPEVPLLSHVLSLIRVISIISHNFINTGVEGLSAFLSVSLLVLV